MSASQNSTPSCGGCVGEGDRNVCVCVCVEEGGS